MKRAKNFLTASALRYMYFALVHSHVSNCRIITSKYSTSNINKIALLRNTAIIIITNCKYKVLVAQFFKNIFKYYKIIVFSKLISCTPITSAIVWYPSQASGRLTISYADISNLTEIQLYFMILTLKQNCLKYPPLYSLLGDIQYQNCKITFDPT